MIGLLFGDCLNNVTGVYICLFIIMYNENSYASTQQPNNLRTFLININKQMQIIRVDVAYRQEALVLNVFHYYPTSLPSYRWYNGFCISYLSQVNNARTKESNIRVESRTAFHCDIDAEFKYEILK